jgi:hypothetical protein
MTSKLIIHTDLHKPNNKLVSCVIGTLLVHRQAMGKHKFIRFTMARTSGSHYLPHYSIFYAWPWGLQPNVILSQDSQVGSPEIGTPVTLEAHNFLCKPLIEISYKEKL